MSAKQREFLVLLLRSILDVVVFFGIGSRSYFTFAFLIAVIAYVYYKPWLDPIFEGYLDRLSITQENRKRRILYALYFGSSWPSATWVWLYDHMISSTDEEKKS